MEPRRRLLERERADILRQVLPQPREKLCAAHVRLCPERADLTSCVDTCVRPAAAGYFHRLAEQACQQRLYLFLYGVARVALLLPAAVPAAVIAEREPEISHCRPLRVSVYTIGGLRARHIC